MSKTRVLVVDDSAFFRRRIAEILDADNHLEVVATASNGKEAVSMVKKIRPDVVTMDIEMPIMDGITAVRKIMRDQPTPVLMFSSLTSEGAKATLDALEAGALDFLPKSLGDIAADKQTAKRQLCARVRILGARGLPQGVSSSAADHKLATQTAYHHDVADFVHNTFDPAELKLILIGTSTGGPAALQRIIPGLRKDIPIPIVVAQHMPEAFTEPFAMRLNAVSQVNVEQVIDREVLKAGSVYIAPGGHQLELLEDNDKIIAKVYKATAEHTYKPSVDITFSSAAPLFPGRILAIVLTGMGVDGREGARNIKTHGSFVWTQDEESCVVYGMPMAVRRAGLADREMSLDAINMELRRI